MSVNVRRYRDGVRWLVDVWVKKPGDGALVRDRKVVGGSKIQARAWGLERERALLDSRGKLDKPCPAFDTFAFSWLKTYPVAAGNSKETTRTKRSHVTTHLVPFFGAITLDKIDRLLLDKFLAYLWGVKVGKPTNARVRRVGTGERPIRPRSVAHVLSTLSKMLRCAEEWGQVERLPKFPKVRVPEQPFAYYDRDEAARLVEHAGGVEERALLTFALHTGARAGEQLAVCDGDIDMKLKIVTFSRSSVRGVVRQSTKSGKVRTVPMTDDLVRALQAVRASRGIRSLDGNDLVFARPDGRPLDLFRLHRVLRRAQKRAGLRMIRWHDLRHSYASILTGGGAPIRRVQTWLGHATLGMTMRYSHLAPDGGREHLSAFDIPAATGHMEATAGGSKGSTTKS